MAKMNYFRFFVMVATSTILMFGLMYFNTFALGHILFSQTRLWMAIMMGAVMSMIMLAFMGSMYPSRRVNRAIGLASAIVAAAALFMVRSQETVDEVSWMKAMIPHHSIAIMTSERAHIRDPQVRLIADRIIDAQIREIAKMKRAIARLERHPVASGAPDLPSYRDRSASPPPGDSDAAAGVNTLAPVR